MHPYVGRFFLKIGCNKLLPVWYDTHGNVHFEVPPELKRSRIGEQLLIQRCSCYVPIVHICNGIMGLKGHCCCFRQGIAEIAYSLPRLRVEAIKIIKMCVDKQGLENVEAFTVRRSVVINALLWLKTHHKWYRDDPDLIIDESNLSWMNGQEEAALSVHTIHDSDELKDDSRGVVCGLNDTTNIEAETNCMEYSGSISETIQGISSKHCNEILDELKTTCQSKFVLLK